MSSFGVLNRQTRDIAALFAVVLATIMSAFVPALVSAAQITSRSIELSSSVAGAQNVSYDISFTATQTAGAVLVQFCGNTPLIGETCDAPAGFSAASATSTAGTVTHPADNEIIVTDSVATGAHSLDVAGINNPTSEGPLYARIVTYTDAAAAGSYTDTDAGTHKDDGSVAMSIVKGINVGGAVLETMLFCVSGETINPGCVGSGGALTAPTLKLGKDTNGVIALDSSQVYTGTIYSQISTNAVNGAIVSLKSDATDCGGLRRSSDLTACDIGPAGIGVNTVEQGQAKFGVMTGAIDTDADGTVQPSANYSSTLYHMNFVSGNTGGVTSTYGDPIFNTDGHPANNKDMPLTFGASVANNTPAGNYSAALSLIATGTF